MPHRNFSPFYLYLASQRLRAMGSLGDTREGFVQGFDRRPRGLHVITEARILMNTPALGRSQLLSVVQEILRARCTQLLLHVSASLEQLEVWLLC